MSRIWTLQDLTEAQRRALAAANEAKETAYNPYSKFFVGAALITHEGVIIKGSNVENAAFGSTICAERSAIVAANVQGFRVFECLAVIARGATSAATDITYPCGACRQMLVELRHIAESNLPIVLSTTRMDKIVITSIDELAPSGFGPKSIGVNVKSYRT